MGPIRPWSLVPESVATSKYAQWHSSCLDGPSTGRCSMEPGCSYNQIGFLAEIFSTPKTTAVILSLLEPEYEGSTEELPRSQIHIGAPPKATTRTHGIISIRMMK